MRIPPSLKHLLSYVVPSIPNPPAAPSPLSCLARGLIKSLETEEWKTNPVDIGKDEPMISCKGVTLRYVTGAHGYLFTEPDELTHHLSEEDKDAIKLALLANYRLRRGKERMELSERAARVFAPFEALGCPDKP